MTRIIDEQNIPMTLVGVIPVVHDKPSFATPVFRDSDVGFDYIQCSKNKRRIQHFSSLGFMFASAEHARRVSRNEPTHVGQEILFGFCMQGQDYVLPRYEMSDLLRENFLNFEKLTFLQWTIVRFINDPKFILKLSDGSVRQLVRNFARKDMIDVTRFSVSENAVLSEIFQSKRSTKNIKMQVDKLYTYKNFSSARWKELAKSIISDKKFNYKKIIDANNGLHRFSIGDKKNTLEMYIKEAIGSESEYRDYLLLKYREAESLYGKSV